MSFNEAWGNRVDGDSLAGQQRGHALHHADDAGLGQRVIGLPQVARDAGNRRHTDDAPAGLECTRGQQGLIDALLRREVDVDHRLPQVRLHIGNRLVAGNAGVVHHRVPTAIGQCRLRQRLRCVDGTNVQCQRLGAQARGHLVESGLRLRDVQANQLCTVAYHDFGDGCAYAA